MTTLLVVAMTTAAVAVAWVAKRRAPRTSPAVTELLARPVLPALAALDPADLAVVACAVLHREGYRAMRVGGNRPFPVRTPGGRLALVYCRAWRHALVGRNQVCHFADAIKRKGASEGVLVSSGRFSDCAVEAAARQSIRLLDGGAIVRRLQTR